MAYGFGANTAGATSAPVSTGQFTARHTLLHLNSLLDVKALLVRVTVSREGKSIRDCGGENQPSRITRRGKKKE